MTEPFSARNMARVTALAVPNEIVRLILAHLLQFKAKSTSCLRVSRTWRSIGLPMLYKDTVLEQDGLELFNDALTSFSHLASLIQSLTLHISLNERKTDIRQHLLALSKQVRTMVNLTTFSLTVRSRCTRYNFVSDGSDVWDEYLTYSFLRFLPPSVHNLELDTGAVERDYDDIHICDELRTLMSRQLRNLRLSRDICCPDIFAGDGLSTPAAMRTIIINVSARLMSGWYCHTWNAQYPSHTEALSNTSIALAARSRVEQGIFPHLTKLLVIGRHVPRELQDVERFRRFDGAAKRDVLANTTTIVPYTTMYHNIWARIDPTDTTEDENKWSPSISQGLFRGCSELYRFLEDDAWIETTTGSRFPAEYRSSSQSHQIGSSGSSTYQWKQPDYAGTLPKMIKVSGHGWHALKSLSYWEEKENRPLLSPWTVDGLHCDDPMLRQMSAHESYLVGLGRIPREMPRDARGPNLDDGVPFYR